MKLLPVLIIMLLVFCSQRLDALREADRLEKYDFASLAVFDESIPVSGSVVFEMPYDSIEDISVDSPVIFLGQVVGYKERLLLDNLEWIDWDAYDVYDGIIMQSTEVLVGKMPEPDNKITLAVRALTENGDGTPHSRHINREIDIFGDGLQSMRSANAPEYLVYAGPSRPGTPEHEAGLWWISTAGGAVRVFEDGLLGEGKDRPFARFWGVNEEGENGWVFPYDLQDARDAAELAKAGIEDTSGTPD
ncbi:MAG: hypothetical protein OXD37_02940 [Acidimicrobiaceae bacterium]|nr:hypothetical protein [Acidimicrobiaceae bacterium]